jgi:hypothetical protein
MDLYDFNTARKEVMDMSKIKALSDVALMTLYLAVEEDGINDETRELAEQLLIEIQRRGLDKIQQ